MYVNRLRKHQHLNQNQKDLYVPVQEGHADLTKYGKLVVVNVYVQLAKQPN